jgi:phosphatidylethanolamine-binding protein (PEBP) family uncharacterized protein
MDLALDTKTLVIGSPAFAHGDPIPSRYTCEGENVNPALTIENIPPGTKSLAIIVEDPDAGADAFVHWVAWNIHPQEMILENSKPGTEGNNSFKQAKYQDHARHPERTAIFLKCMLWMFYSAYRLSLLGTRWKKPCNVTFSQWGN